jgi:hypothetical protein
VDAVAWDTDGLCKLVLAQPEPIQEFFLQDRAGSERACQICCITPTKAASIPASSSGRSWRTTASPAR